MSLSQTIPSNKLIILFFSALVFLLWFLSRDFATQLKLIGLGAIALGIIALVLAERNSASVVKHLLRDIGIAFIVAVVVTVVYEYSTRHLDERITMLNVIDKAMAEFMPPSVWDEVKQEVLQRQRMRRNVDFEFKVLRDAKLSNGKYVTAPAGQVILWMKYGYDLYGMTASPIDVEIQHELAYEMWNDKLQIPRFERVSVISDHGKKVKMYVGDELQKIDDGKGSIRLKGPNVVQLPPARLNEPVRIESERYELVSAPGSYNIVMPELAASLDNSPDPTIRVTISEVPYDLDVSLNTYYAAHSFKQPDKSKNFWTYEKIVLPGQGFSVIVQPKSQSSVGLAASNQ
jgi:hypothetical protein